MKTVAMGLCLAAIGFAGAASAEQTMAPGGNDRVVARAEALAHADQMFTRLDVNKDGKLDPADRIAMRTALFDQMDSNKDGQISRAEFTAARPEMGGHGWGEPGDKPGMRGDRTGAQPMGSRGMGGHGMRGHGMGGMMLMHMADGNHDGSVTKDEFRAAAATHFDAADTNHDGKLTPAERQAAHQARRGHMRGMMQHGMSDDASMPPPVN
jgi:hypothetical protein